MYCKRLEVCIVCKNSIQGVQRCVWFACLDFKKRYLRNVINQYIKLLSKKFTSVQKMRIKPEVEFNSYMYIQGKCIQQGLVGIIDFSTTLIYTKKKNAISFFLPSLFIFLLSTWWGNIIHVEFHCIFFSHYYLKTFCVTMQSLI